MGFIPKFDFLKTNDFMYKGFRIRVSKVNWCNHRNGYLSTELCYHVWMRCPDKKYEWESPMNLEATPFQLIEHIKEYGINRIEERSKSNE